MAPMVSKSIVMFYYVPRFNISHVTKVSAQTSARGCKKCIQLWKTWHRFLDFINRWYFTLILNFEHDDFILINCSGSFYYGTDIFKIQKLPPEVFLKVSQNSHENTYARVSFSFGKFLREPFLQATISQNVKAYI